MAIPRSLLAIAVCLALALAGGLWFGIQKKAVVAHYTPAVVRHAAPQAVPELPPALKTGFMAVSPVEAQAINADVAVSTAPVEPARPFILNLKGMLRDEPASLGGLENRNLALDCLTTAVYYEAASESDQGERAVAQVVLNRVRHPAFPKSVCGVVYQGAERTTGCQFTFTCDGSLARHPSQGGWLRARRIALAALNGAIEPSVGTATHYHADWVVPYWAPSLDKVTAIGAHIFYRWKGYWGKRAAFSGAYAGEPVGVNFPGLPYDPVQGPQDASVESELAPNHSRLLADQLNYSGPQRESAASAPAGLRADQGRLRADQGKGMLLADQNRGTLDDGRSATILKDKP